MDKYNRFKYIDGDKFREMLNDQNLIDFVQGCSDNFFYKQGYLAGLIKADTLLSELQRKDGFDKCPSCNEELQENSLKLMAITRAAMMDMRPNCFICKWYFLNQTNIDKDEQCSYKDIHDIDTKPPCCYLSGGGADHEFVWRYRDDCKNRFINGYPKGYLEQTEKLLSLLEEVCKDVREETGGTEVCGLCEYDGPDWQECPGCDRDDCFVLRREIKEQYLPHLAFEK